MYGLARFTACAALIMTGVIIARAMPIAPAGKPIALATPAHPTGAVVIGATTGEPLVPLPIELPPPAFVSQQLRLPPDVRLDPSHPAGPRPGIVAPAGLTNLALGRSVSSSDPAPLIGALDMVTDGDKVALDGRIVELTRGRQWVQIDLGKPMELWAVLVWHDHIQQDVCRDVVVHVSNDPDFRLGVRELFNNDHDNTSGLGPGPDFEYIETCDGHAIDAGGAVARYVRLYSNGSVGWRENRYCEVEVWGRAPSGFLRWFNVGPWFQRTLP